MPVRISTMVVGIERRRRMVSIILGRDHYSKSPSGQTVSARRGNRWARMIDSYAPTTTASVYSTNILARELHACCSGPRHRNLDGDGRIA